MAMRVFIFIEWRYIFTLYIGKISDGDGSVGEATAFVVACCWYQIMALVTLIHLSRTRSL